MLSNVMFLLNRLESPGIIFTKDQDSRKTFQPRDTLWAELFESRSREGSKNQKICKGKGKNHTKIVPNSAIKNHHCERSQLNETRFEDRWNGIKILTKGDLLGALNCFFPQLALTPSPLEPRIPILDSKFSLFTEGIPLAQRNEPPLGRKMRDNRKIENVGRVTWSKRKNLYSSVLKCSPRKIDSKKFQRLRKDIIVLNSMTARRVLSDDMKTEVEARVETKEDNAYPDGNQDSVLQGIFALLENTDIEVKRKTHTFPPPKSTNNPFLSMPFLYSTSYAKCWQQFQD
ncbi:hypothetical protein DMENIID0001_061110 [Sergentomyia squamirostris]